MEDKIDNLLENIFSNINSWLNFAELKNAANLTFVVACLGVFFGGEQKNIFLYIICILFILSGLLSLISFMPKTSKNSKGKYDSDYKYVNFNKMNDNLMYFDNIKNYTCDTYIKQICIKYYEETTYNPTNYQLDLTEEIIINSKITSKKYNLFKKALYFDLFGLFLFIIFIILA